MAKKKTGINWSVRWKNPQFVVRTLASIFLPALAFLGLDWEMMTSWAALGDAGMQIISNPVVLAIIAINFINIIPDPTHNNVLDTEYILNRRTPNVDKKGQPKGK